MLRRFSIRDIRREVGELKANICINKERVYSSSCHSHLLKTSELDLSFAKAFRKAIRKREPRKYL